MGEFIVVCILVWAIWQVARLGKSNTSKEKFSQPEISISNSRSSSRSNVTHDLGPITRASVGGWVLNPKSPFPLTVTNVDEAFACEFKAFCDEKRFLGVEQFRWSLVPKIARSNLRCQEIDEYVRIFKPVYLNEIERLKSDSVEWATAGEKDREDLLGTLKLQAVKRLDIQPGCDLVTLFECEPSGATIDDALIDRFGFETLQFYFRYAGDMKKVHVVPAEYRGQREEFEKLAEKGLACHGAEITLADILTTLKLKDMSNLVADLNPPRWSRKNQAIEFLLAVPNLHERLGRVISFRELFQPINLMKKVGAPQALFISAVGAGRNPNRMNRTGVGTPEVGVPVPPSNLPDE